LSQSLQPASHDFGQDRELDPFLWETGDRQCGDWRSGHRPHIVDRVKSCDPTIDERVVDDRREKVERLNDRKIVGKAVNSCIVSQFEADNDIRVVWLLW
jgi:hypothetical protein